MTEKFKVTLRRGNQPSIKETYDNEYEVYADYLIFMTTPTYSSISIRKIGRSSGGTQ